MELKMMELYKKYRPRKLEAMIGQDSTVKMLKQMLKRNRLPHTLLFEGPSGCGKTTFARILRKTLGCGKHDFVEKNCADFRGIDMVRDIRSHLQQAPISGSCRIWLIDEAHKLSNDAQNAFLKMLEDTPNHVYFMLATTDPQKLLPTIRTRCTEAIVKKLSNSNMQKLIGRVCKKEEVEIPEEVIEEIIESSEGSARKALVLLNQIIDLEDEEDMLETIKATTMEIQAKIIARTLLNPRVKWYEMAKIIRETAGEEAEQIRWMVLGYSKKVLLSGGKQAGRAYIIIDAFRDNFYDSKLAGLAAACYEVVIGGSDK